jgi:hypothetical protein
VNLPASPDLLLLLLVLHVAGLGYLIWRVGRIERLLASDPKLRKGLSRQRGKVIPILKEQIEPGPFKPDGPDEKDRR